MDGQGIGGFALAFKSLGLRWFWLVVSSGVSYGYNGHRIWPFAWILTPMVLTALNELRRHTSGDSRRFFGSALIVGCIAVPAWWIAGLATGGEATAIAALSMGCGTLGMGLYAQGMASWAALAHGGQDLAAAWQRSAHVTWASTVVLVAGGLAGTVALAMDGRPLDYVPALDGWSNLWALAGFIVVIAPFVSAGATAYATRRSLEEHIAAAV